MQKDELANCIEYLAKPELMGKEKIIRALSYFGINIDTRFSFLKEGAAAKKVLTSDKLSELWNKL